MFADLDLQADWHPQPLTLATSRNQGDLATDLLFIGTNWLNLAAAWYLTKQGQYAVTLAVPPHTLDQTQLGYAGLLQIPDALYRLEQQGDGLLTQLVENGWLSTSYAVLHHLHYPSLWGRQPPLVTHRAAPLVIPQQLWHALIAAIHRQGGQLVPIKTFTGWACVDRWHRVSADTSNLFSRQVIWHAAQLPSNNRRFLGTRLRFHDHHFWLATPQSAATVHAMGDINCDLHHRWWLRRLHDRLVIATSAHSQRPPPLRHARLVHQWRNPLVHSPQNLPCVGAISGNPTAIATFDGGGLALQLGVGIQLARCLVGLDSPSALAPPLLLHAYG